VDLVYNTYSLFRQFCGAKISLKKTNVIYFLDLFYSESFLLFRKCWACALIQCRRNNNKTTGRVVIPPKLSCNYKTAPAKASATTSNTKSRLDTKVDCWGKGPSNRKYLGRDFQSCLKNKTEICLFGPF
jgi:hypothetical protein